MSIRLKCVYGKEVLVKPGHVVQVRRAGDIAVNYADPAKAKNLLGWEAEYDLDRMCEDSWRWQSGNPNGYAE